jgi:hypothetical protein
MDGLGAPRPLLERQERRAAKGKERFRAKFKRETLDHPAAPAVERMIGSIARLGRGGEGFPALASGHADENDRANVAEVARPLARLEPQSPARNEASLRDRLENSLDRP